MSSLGLGTDGYYGESSSSGGGSGADVTPPTVTPTSPLPSIDPGAVDGFPASFDAARRVPIVFSVVDAEAGLALVSVVVDTEKYRGLVAVRGGAAVGKFMMSSSIDDVTDGVEISLLIDDGWSSVDAGVGYVMVTVDAVDLAGNVVTSVMQYRVPPTAPTATVAIDAVAMDHVAEALKLVPEQFK